MASRTVEFLLQVRGNLEEKAESGAKATRGLGESMRVATNVAGIMASGLLAAGAAAGAFLSDVTDLIDETNTLGRASGLANETIAGLRQAARATGKDLQDLVPKNLAKNMLAAADGSARMEDAFARMGVQVTDQNGELRDADSVFREVIDSLTGMENQTEAAGIAAQVLGRNGRELLSAFGSSEDLDRFVDQAERFGVDVGPAAVEATGRWQGAMANMELALDNAKQGLFELGSSSLVTDMINNVTLGFVFVTEFIESVVDDIAEQFGRVGKLFRREISLGDFFAESIEAGNAFANAWAAATDEAREFYRTTNGAGGELDLPFAGEPTGGGGGGGGGGGASKAVEDNTRQLQEHQHSMEDLVELQLDWWQASVAQVSEDLAPVAASLDDLIDRIEQDIRHSENAAGRFDIAMAGIADGLGGLQDLPSLLGGAGGAALAAAGPFGAIAQAVLEIPSTMSALRDVATGLLDSVLGFPGEFATALLEDLPAVLDRTTRTIENLPDTLAALPGIISEAIPGLIEGLVQAVPRIVIGFNRLFFESMFLGARLVFAVLKGLFELLPGQMKEAITDWWQGALADIGEFVRQLTQPLRGEQGNILGTNFAADKGDVKLLGIDLPGFDTGGFVRRGGLAKVDDDELILTPTHQRMLGLRGGRASGGGAGRVAINIGQVVANDPVDFAEKMQRLQGVFGRNLSLDAYVEPA